MTTADAAALAGSGQGASGPPLRTLLDFVAWAIGVESENDARQSPFLLDQLPALGEAARRMQVSRFF